MLNFRVVVDGVERIDYQKYIDENMLPYDGFVRQEMDGVLALLAGKLTDELRRLRPGRGGREADSPLMQADLHFEVRPGDGPTLEQELRKAGPSEFPTLVAYLNVQHGDRRYSEVYTGVGISRQTFSNLMSFDANAGCDRDNVMRIAFAVRANVEDAVRLLNAKGFAFRPTVKEDLVLRHCLVRRIHDPHAVNDLLERHGCKPLFFMS